LLAQNIVASFLSLVMNSRELPHKIDAGCTKSPRGKHSILINKTLYCPISLKGIYGMVNLYPPVPKLNALFKIESSINMATIS